MTESASLTQAAIVTGGAVRLGRAIAIGLAKRGYDIALVYGRSQDAATKTQTEIAEYGVQCKLFQAELGDATALALLIDRIVAAFPQVNTLINNASTYKGGTIADTAVATFDEQFAVNVRAPFLLSQAFAGNVAEGMIVNIIDNKVGFHQYQYAAYLLSKKALLEFTRMAAMEFAPRIRVNGVAPGVVLPAESRSAEYLEWRRRAIPLERSGSPEDIVRAIGFLLDSPFITGQIITVDGGENLAHVGRNAVEYGEDDAK